MKNDRKDLVHEFDHVISDESCSARLTLHTEFHHNGGGNPKLADKGSNGLFANQELTISHYGGDISLSFYLHEFNSDALRQLADALDKNEAIAAAKLLELQSKPEHKLKLSTKGK